MPKGICENCIVKVEEFYDFLDQCVNTESMLKSYCATLSFADQLKCQGKVSLACLLVLYKWINIYPCISELPIIYYRL